MHADATSVRLERKFVLKMRVNGWGNKTILYHKTNKEASTAFCSVVKQLESCWSTQEVGRNTRLRLVFPYTSFVLIYLHLFIHLSRVYYERTI